MSFEELQQFASRINQVIWGEFIAAEFDGELPMQATTSEEIGRTALAGALAFDSSYWSRRTEPHY
jgi:hypothetical protein